MIIFIPMNRAGVPKFTSKIGRLKNIQPKTQQDTAKILQKMNCNANFVPKNGKIKQRKIRAKKWANMLGLFSNSKICRMDIRYCEASTCPNLNAYGYLGYEPI